MVLSWGLHLGRWMTWSDENEVLVARTKRVQSNWPFSSPWIWIWLIIMLFQNGCFESWCYHVCALCFHLEQSRSSFVVSFVLLETFSRNHTILWCVIEIMGLTHRLTVKELSLAIKYTPPIPISRYLKSFMSHYFSKQWYWNWGFCSLASWRKWQPSLMGRSKSNLSLGHFNFICVICYDCTYLSRAHWTSVGCSSSMSILISVL